MVSIAIWKPPPVDGPLVEMGHSPWIDAYLEVAMCLRCGSCSSDCWVVFEWQAESRCGLSLTRAPLPLGGYQRASGVRTGAL